MKDKSGKKYKIGDVSKILGISPDLLRYYEKKGVVKPEKDSSNDYRYYDFWDLNFLLDCLWFKNYGFSIDKVAEMVKITSVEELSGLFLNKEEELRQTIRRSQLLLERSGKYRDNLAQVRDKLGVCEICDSPEYIMYLNRYADTFDESPEMQRLSHRWLDLMPFTRRCFEVRREDFLAGTGQDYAWGMSLEMEYADLLGVTAEPPVVRVPSCRSLHSVFTSTGKGNFSPTCMQYMADYCAEHGLEVCGPVRGNLLCSLKGETEMTGYFEAWVPIRGGEDF